MGDVLIEMRFEEFQTAGFKGVADEIIPLLQLVQRKNGFISSETVAEIARFAGVSEAQVYTVASFYAQFRFHKPGRNHVCVCMGTACHVQGGAELSQEAQGLLHIRPGETSRDGEFDLQEVACLGCCAQAAVVEINGKIYARMSRDKLRETLHQALEEHERA